MKLVTRVEEGQCCKKHKSPPDTEAKVRLWWKDRGEITGADPG